MWWDPLRRSAEFCWLVVVVDGIKQRLVGLVWFGVALAFGEEVVVLVVVVFSRVICSEEVVVSVSVVVDISSKGNLLCD